MMKIYDPPRKMPFQRLHKAIYKGCGDKNHNPRKGTEDLKSSKYSAISSREDKNHNPRKGTEEDRVAQIKAQIAETRDKNHNPRKGTELVVKVLISRGVC